MQIRFKEAAGRRLERLREKFRNEVDGFKREFSESRFLNKATRNSAAAGFVAAYAAIFAAVASPQYLKAHYVIFPALACILIGKVVSRKSGINYDAKYSARAGFIAGAILSAALAASDWDGMEKFVKEHASPEQIVEYYDSTCTFRQQMAEEALQPELHFECKE